MLVPVASSKNYTPFNIKNIDCVEFNCIYKCINAKQGDKTIAFLLFPIIKWETKVLKVK